MKNYLGFQNVFYLTLRIPFSDIAEATDSSNSPEFPMHVVQPYPTIWKPCWLRYFCNPLDETKTWIIRETIHTKSESLIQIKYLLSKYFVTTPEPGARLVFTQGFTWWTVYSTKIIRKRVEDSDHSQVQWDGSSHSRSGKRITGQMQQLLTCKPSSQAFFATRAAPNMTLGFDVFVQLVIAAITTLPCLSSAGCPWNENSATLSCTSFGTAKP